ncbi:hypothetical protein Dimus_023977 [Dionaea muscipula]
MACSLNNGISLSGSSSYSKGIPNLVVSPSPSDYFKPKKIPALGSSFLWGQSLVVPDHKGSNSSSKVSAQAHVSSFCMSKA